MKKAYLKWLIPVVVLYVMVGIACLVFGGYYKNEVYQNELSYMSKSLKKGLNYTDMLVKTAVDHSDSTAVFINKFEVASDKEQILAQLNQLIKDEYVKSAIICNYTGIGFDNKGEDVSLAGESFFEEIKDKYSNGGSGLVQVYEDGFFPAYNLLVVHQFEYANDRKGFLISDMDLSSLYNALFPDKEIYDEIALISLTGQVLVGEESGSDFFYNKKYNFQYDILKLNISQKKETIVEVDDGYLMLVPSDITATATIAVVTNDSLKTRPQVKLKTHRFRVFVLMVLLCIAVYVAINIFIYHFIRYLRRQRMSRESAKIKVDKLTGLYNEVGVRDEIQKYVNSQTINKGGILFVISLEMDNSEGKEKAAKALGNALPEKYRLTDIIGRSDENSLLVFLKDISEEKDIRKQTDELQIFLYDFKTEMDQEEYTMTIRVGRALYPKDGDDADQLLKTAQKALGESKRSTK